MFSTLQVWCIIKISVLHFKVSTCTLLSPLFVGKPIPLPERNVGCLIPKDFLVFRIWCILSFWGMFMREKGSGEQRIWYATDYEDNLKNLSIPHVVWNIFCLIFTFSENIAIWSVLEIFLCQLFGKLTCCLISCFFLRWLRKWQETNLRHSWSWPIR